MSVKIVVDSASNIGHEKASRYNITIIPATVIFGDDEYQDGVDLDTSGLFEKVEKSSAFPRTSAPSVGLFESTYRRAAQDGATGILSIHVAEKLSGTLNAARLAAQTVSNDSGVPIRVVDSGTTSVGCGLPAVLTARFIQTGCSLDEAAAFFQRVISHSRTLVVLDTIEYLQKGGRISSASALGEGFLKLKLILTVHDGDVVPLARERTRGKLLSHVTSLLKEHPTLAYVGIAVTDEDTAADLRQAIRLVYAGRIEEFRQTAGISAHTGPRAGHICVVTQELEGELDQIER